MKHCQRLFINNLFIQIFAFIIFVSVNIEHALAAPTGGRVVQGMVSVTYNPPIIRIVQQTEDAIVLWRSFDLAVGERLEIVQPSQKSRLINQVTNGGLSDIRGNIESNGQVFLINPRGIHHQKAAHARVGGLVLSGLDLSPSDEIRKTIKLKNIDPSITGDIINFGTIETAHGGNAALVGRWVLNKGLIRGELSSVALAVGREADILFEDNGLINLNVIQEEPKVAGVTSAPLGNYGEIVVPSGRIFVAGSVSSRAFKLLRQTGGAVASDSEIALAPGSSFKFGLGSKFRNHGLLDTSNPYNDREPARHGGRIVVIADTFQNTHPISAATLEKSSAGQIVIAASDTVTLAEGSNLSVDAGPYADGGAITVLGKNILIQDAYISADGGGKILVGGKGTSTTSHLTATTNIIAQSDIRTSAEFSVGTVKFWAKETIDLSGTIEGHSYRGAEISVTSLGKLRFNTLVEVPATSRRPDRNGSLLLQARDLLVAASEDAWVVNSQKLDKTLDAARVTLYAQQDIVFAGGSAPIILGDDTLDDSHAHASSLQVQAANKLRVENTNILYLGEIAISAKKEIRISNFTTIGGPGSTSARNCHIAAFHNVYISD
jgi:filamentous hemagglutinin family protein